MSQFITNVIGYFGYNVNITIDPISGSPRPISPGEKPCLSQEQYGVNIDPQVKLECCEALSLMQNTKSGIKDTPSSIQVSDLSAFPASDCPVTSAHVCAMIVNAEHCSLPKVFASSPAFLFENPISSDLFFQTKTNTPPVASEVTKKSPPNFPAVKTQNFSDPAPLTKKIPD